MARDCVGRDGAVDPAGIWDLVVGDLSGTSRGRSSWRTFVETFVRQQHPRTTSPAGPGSWRRCTGVLWEVAEGCPWGLGAGDVRGCCGKWGRIVPGCWRRTRVLWEVGEDCSWVLATYEGAVGGGGGLCVLGPVLCWCGRGRG